MSNYPANRNDSAPMNPADLVAHRERALEVLTRAFSGDRISMDEYERRAGEIQKAQSPVDVELIVADLPGAYDPDGAPSPVVDSQPTPIDPHLVGSQTIACIMGERQLMGDWLNGNRVESFTMMGSTKIDLRDVALPPERLKIEVFVLMGETRVVVPRGMAVRMNVFPFMGDATAKRDVNQRVTPGEPFVLIEGFVMMGSLVVVTQD